MTTESDAEKWLAKRLIEHGVTILSGAPDRAARMERFRSAIFAGYLEEVIAGKSATTGKAETYSQLFERLYSEPLTKPSTTKQRQGNATC